MEAAREAQEKQRRERRETLEFELSPDSEDDAGNGIEEVQQAWIDCDSVQDFKSMFQVYGAERCYHWFQTLTRRFMQAKQIYAVQLTEAQLEIQEAGNQARETGQALRAANTQITELNIQIDQQAEDNRDLRASVRLFRQMEGRRPFSSEETNHHFQEGREKEIPDPEQFEKGTPTEYNHWARQVRDKLEVDADRFRTEKRKITYLATRIKGASAEYIEPYLQYGADGTSMIKTVDDFLLLMARRWGDPYAKQNALDELNRLWQNNRELSEFMGDFFRLAAIAQLSEEEQMEHLRKRSNPKFSEVILMTTFDSLNQMVDGLHLIARNRKAQAKDRAVLGTGGSQRGGGQQRGRSNTPAPVVPEGTSAPTQRDGRLQRDLSKIKCYACQELGHYANNCTKGNDSPASKS